jgi:chromosome segregation ATPase
MQQSLASLIRLSKFRLDEKKATLAQLRENADTLRHNIQAISNEISQEGNSINGDRLKASVYPHWRESALVRQQNLRTSLQSIEDLMQVVNEDIIELFNELKRYEITKDDLSHQQGKKQAKKDMMQLDEQGLSRFRNRG